MISYELAVKLKKAGFPQKTWFWYDDEKSLSVGYERRMGNTGYPKKIEEIYHKNIVACPSLSELIEACGEKFIGLLRSDDLKEWRALCPIEKGINVAYDSSTPEKAVAKLWLVLNTNDPR